MIALSEVVQLCIELIKRAETAEARVKELETMHMLAEKDLRNLQEEYRHHREEHAKCRLPLSE